MSPGSTRHVVRTRHCGGDRALVEKELNGVRGKGVEPSCGCGKGAESFLENNDHIHVSTVLPSLWLSVHTVHKYKVQIQQSNN